MSKGFFMKREIFSKNATEDNSTTKFESVNSFIRGHKLNSDSESGKAGASWMRHRFGAHNFIEFIFGQVAELQGRVAQTQALVMGFVSDLRGLVVADPGTKSRYQH